MSYEETAIPIAIDYPGFAIANLQTAPTMRNEPKSSLFG